MYLSSIRQKILSHALLQADAAASAIAKECRSTEKTVRNTLWDLKEQGIIKPFAPVNIHALGLTDYCICFTLASDNAKSRRDTFEFLNNSSKVAWLAELSGDFHFSVSIMARDIFEISDFFNTLSVQIKNVSIEKHFALRVNWTSFRCKYFGSEASKIEKLSRGKPAAQQVIDETDHSILHGLAQYSGESNFKIAARLKISNTTFSYRVNLLKQKGILLGSIYYLNVNRLGLHAFRIIVYAKNANRSLTKKLSLFAFKHTYVSAFIECIGNWDYELNVEVPDPAMISTITQELYSKFGKQLRFIKTVAVLQTIKTAPYPFLKE